MRDCTLSFPSADGEDVGDYQRLFALPDASQMASKTDI